MNDTITLHVPIQLEYFSEQMVRARPLGPWKLQLVGRSWEQLRKPLTRRLSKLLPDTLPSDLFAGMLPAEFEQWTTTVRLPPQERDTRWSEPLRIEMDSFRWQLANGHCVVRVPAVHCMLFGKPEELDEAAITAQAQVALLRIAENRDLLALSQRFARRRFAFHSLPLVVPLGKPGEKKEQEKTEHRKKVSALRAAASDLTQAKLTAVYGLDEKAADLAEHFQGEAPQSVLLVGPAGVGKTSLVYRLVALRQQLGLGERRIWSTSGARIVSGMSGLGMWQQRCSKLIRQAQATQAILHLGSLFELMEAGKVDGQPGVASMVRQSIARGKLLAIAECTPEQLAMIEREDPMLLRAFTRVEFREFEAARIRQILQAAAADIGGAQWTYSPQAIEELYRLHRRFATYSAMPATALRLMSTMFDEVAPGSTISADAVARAFAQQTGLPRFLVDDSIPLDLQAIGRELAAHVIGQAEPVELIVNLIATLKARLVRPGRPLASLMFIGPTGVGKTEMAKAIARLLYSDTSRMLRIDMSEYSSPGAAVKLIGQGGDGDGTLTSPIREQPFSVVLLDEFEKAHPHVFDILLQLLGEGRLTDSQGRLADFRNAVVIITSNLGAESFRPGSFGFGDGEAGNWREHFQREVRKFVRPEFLGRLDRIVPFRPLPKEVVQQIARRELGQLSQRPGLKYSESSLVVSEAAIELLSELGYQPQYGARPLRRVLEREVAVPVANALSEISPESTWTFEVTAPAGKIVVRSEKKSSKTKSHKAIEAEVINAWQTVGTMARLARFCGPMRDLENEIERTQRQNETLSKCLQDAASPRRLAAIREQLQQGQAMVEAARRVRAQLLQVVEHIDREHLTLLVAWYRNQTVVWSDWQALVQVQRTQLRQATESVIRRRVASGNSLCLIVSGSGKPQLEILWKAYRQLASENQWAVTCYLLHPYDPQRDENSAEYRKRLSERRGEDLPKAEDGPSLRFPAAGQASQQTPMLLADGYLHDGGEQFNRSLPQLCGFALQFVGLGVASWLENEGGIVHFFDSSTMGAKRRQRFKVSVFEQRLSQIALPQDWLEPTTTRDKDPRRIVDIVAQEIFSAEATHASFAQGKLGDALVSIIRQEHDRALWEAIGFQGIPGGARLNFLELDVPF